MADEVARIEVRPQKNGKWKVSGVGDPFDDRAAALAAARKVAGSVEAFDKDGNSLGFTDTYERIALFRVNGDLVGELNGPRGSDQAQRVSLTSPGMGANSTNTSQGAGA